MRLEKLAGPRSYSSGLCDLSAEREGRVPLRVRDAARCTVITEDEDAELDLED